MAYIIYFPIFPIFPVSETSIGDPYALWDFSKMGKLGKWENGF
jgi:hypothetical protein